MYTRLLDALGVSRRSLLRLGGAALLSGLARGTACSWPSSTRPARGVTRPGGASGCCAS